MIEREFVAQKTKEYYIKKYVESKLNKVGVSSIRLKKIPLGEKIIIETSRPSLIVGSRGSNIKELTKALKKEFHLENPQIEIIEVRNIFLDANIVADRIASSLERFGTARFKGIGHKIMENVMNSGALGVELFISGKIPSARAKNWRFYQGYLKKCGDIAIQGVRKAQTSALLKSGIVGIKVAIMPPDVILPDHIEILDEPIQVVEEVAAVEKAVEQKPAKKKSVPKKRVAKKPVVKKETAKEVVKEVVSEPTEEKQESAEETTLKDKDNTEDSPKSNDEVSKEQ
ncbi:30S ribosomal protein S3 [Candidatus Woesearchaeota archaeon CG_4_10_14_0_2_um_filter_33_13]|nr:MAG: 30S ribosomal protein S3 [Candidatus Woesearchaeota archaeon CG_4_10_14_0_2_um_filter_33_13]